MNVTFHTQIWSCSNCHALKCLCTTHLPHPQIIQPLTCWCCEAAVSSLTFFVSFGPKICGSSQLMCDADAALYSDWPCLTMCSTWTMMYHTSKVKKLATHKVMSCTGCGHCYPPDAALLA